MVRTKLTSRRNLYALLLLIEVGVVYHYYGSGVFYSMLWTIPVVAWSTFSRWYRNYHARLRNSRPARIISGIVTVILSVVIGTIWAIIHFTLPLVWYIWAHMGRKQWIIVGGLTFLVLIIYGIRRMVVRRRLAREAEEEAEEGTPATTTTPAEPGAWEVWGRNAIFATILVMFAIGLISFLNEQWVFGKIFRNFLPYSMATLAMIVASWYKRPDVPFAVTAQRWVYRIATLVIVVFIFTDFGPTTPLDQLKAWGATHLPSYMAGSLNRPQGGVGGGNAGGTTSGNRDHWSNHVTDKNRAVVEKVRAAVNKTLPEPQRDLAMQIAWEESSFRQVDDNGNVLTGVNSDGTKDFGVYQIHQAWLEKARSMGINVTGTDEKGTDDNITFGLWIWTSPEYRGPREWATYNTALQVIKKADPGNALIAGMSPLPISPSASAQGGGEGSLGRSFARPTPKEVCSDEEPITLEPQQNGRPSAWSEYYSLSGKTILFVKKESEEGLGFYETQGDSGTGSPERSGSKTVSGYGHQIDRSYKQIRFRTTCEAMDTSRCEAVTFTLQRCTGG